MGRTIMIDLDVALDALTDYCENKCVIREDEWCPDCQYEAFKDVLKALPSAQSEQRWIPCKERPPEEDGAYLVTLIYTDKKGIEHRYTSIQEFKYGMWVMFGMCSIEAWMPLIEPYKEGNDDQKN